jgi:hypothetical protein
VIRHDVEHGLYLNPFKAREHICFLLSLCDELGDALRAIQKINKEVVRYADAAKGRGCHSEGSDL